ncbi:MAG: hypothetical protein BMS9Abin11_1577 [Gammaproteobacteria bacterium]|nr:MAG: hypothetical protein BMS9Abin11_1577 [Gammaproteobacteria bacterium]
MTRRRRRQKAKKEGNGFDFDEKYQYFHLGFLDTDHKGGEIEKLLINNSVLVEKSVTISGCWSFRWKRGKYDESMLNSIFIVCDHPGMPYLQKPWYFVGGKEEKGRHRRKRHEKH